MVGNNRTRTIRADTHLQYVYDWHATRGGNDLALEPVGADLRGNCRHWLYGGKLLSASGRRGGGSRVGFVREGGAHGGNCWSRHGHRCGTWFPDLARRRTLRSLILSGLLGQLGGNVLFQYSLGVVGIGLAVPLCMGMIIIASAVLARVYLRESVSPGAVGSMMVLVVAIWILSLGAGDAYVSVVKQSPQGWLLAGGVAAACFSGFAYAVLGVAIRHGVTGRASIMATTFVVCLVGVVSLGILSYARIGIAGMSGTTHRDWAVMAAAGIFNFVAFIALAKALQLTTVIYVNAVNASQVAMAAVAGVLLFGESFTTALVAGVILTVAGLLLMPRHKPVTPAVSPPAPDSCVAPSDYRPQAPTSEWAVQNRRNLSSSSSKLSSNQRENSSIAAPLGEPSCKPRSLEEGLEQL